ncbi:MAG: hypothetical protein ACI4VG_03385 [Lachnospiraceae bacterium]
MGIDQSRFEKIKESLLGNEPKREGIGTLSEKTIHAILKEYYRKKDCDTEVSIGNFVADIFTGEEIIEIQTRNFFALKKKLEFFLPLYPVTIIYPLARKKWLIWIDPETGEGSEKRKSPKTGSAYDAFKELMKIREFLDNPHLSVKLVFLDMEEYRLLNGWSRDKKRGSHRYDGIPLSLVEEMDLTCPEDYMQLIPPDLLDSFDSKAFAKAAKIKQDRASQVLNILYHLGLVERIGKKKNAYLYRVKA